MKRKIMPLSIINPDNLGVDSHLSGQPAPRAISSSQYREHCLPCKIRKKSSPSAALDSNVSDYEAERPQSCNTSDHGTDMESENMTSTSSDYFGRACHSASTSQSNMSPSNSVSTFATGCESRASLGVTPSDHTSQQASADAINAGASLSTLTRPATGAMICNHADPAVNVFRSISAPTLPTTSTTFNLQAMLDGVTEISDMMATESEAFFRPTPCRPGDVGSHPLTRQPIGNDYELIDFDSDDEALHLNRPS